MRLEKEINSSTVYWQRGEDLPTSIINTKFNKVIVEQTDDLLLMLKGDVHPHIGFYSFVDVAWVISGKLVPTDKIKFWQYIVYPVELGGEPDDKN